MVIRTIDEINIQCENVIEANKLRMNKIQDNLINLASVETMFIDLEKAILKKDFKIRGVKGIQFAWMPIILRKG